MRNTISTCSLNNYKSNMYRTKYLSDDSKSIEEKCLELAPININQKKESPMSYVEKYYDQVLKDKDPEEVLENIGSCILISNDREDEFSCRHILAAWLEILLDIEISEVKVNNLYMENIEKPQGAKSFLSHIMRKGKDMKDFNSLRAVYLYEKGENLEKAAELARLTSGQQANNLKREAACLRSDADLAEIEYQRKKMSKTYIKKR